MKLKPPSTPFSETASALKDPDFVIVKELPKELQLENIEDSIESILGISGIPAGSKSNGTVDSSDPNNRLKECFEKVGANLEAVAQNIFNIACRGESETARITASKFIAEIHGVRTRLEETAPQMAPTTINIQQLNLNNDKKEIINFVMPKI